jgi:hypothetical protein
MAFVCSYRYPAWIGTAEYRREVRPDALQFITEELSLDQPSSN